MHYYNNCKGYLYMVALAICLISCSSEKGSGNFEYSDLKIIDSIEVKLPLEYVANSRWQTFDDSTNTFLIDYGMDNNGSLLILRLDIEKGEYLEPIHIPREGPNGFNSTDLFISYQGEDSIFVFPSAKKEFYLFNSHGKIIKEYSYNSSDFSRFYMSGFYSDIFYGEGEMIIPVINNTRFDDPNYFENVIPFRKYNLTNFSFSDSILYNSELNGKFLPSNLTGGKISNFNDYTALINYPFSDSLYLYNIATKKISAFYCGLNNNNTKFFNHVPNREESREYLVKEKNYEFSKFHNGKVYRIVSHLKNENSRDLKPIEIIRENLRGVTLIEFNPTDSSINYYEMPIVRNFVFHGDHLIVGGVSIRQDENQDTFRKFYIYELN